MTTHTVRVRLGPASTGKVWIDEREVPNITRVRVEGAVHEPTRVLIELIATELDVEAEVEAEKSIEVTRLLEEDDES